MSTLVNNEQRGYLFTTLLQSYLSFSQQNGMLSKHHLLEYQLSFLIAGYDDDEATARIYSARIPENIEPVELMEGLPSGILPDGEARIIGRIIAGYDITLTDLVNQNLTEEKKLELRLPIPYDMLSLRAAVDLAIALIRTTIDLQNLAIMPHMWRPN